MVKDAKFLHAGNKDSDQTAHMSEGTFCNVAHLTSLQLVLIAMWP